MSAEFKTTDKLYEIPYYNEKGYLNRGYITKLFIFLYILMFVSLNILISEISFIIDLDNISFMDLKSKEFHIMYLELYKDYILWNLSLDNQASFEFINIFLVSMFLPLYFLRKFYKSIKFKGKIQSSLASLKLNQYYLLKYNKKYSTAEFKLIKGEKINFEGFFKSREDLCQLFGYSAIVGKLLLNSIIILSSPILFTSIDEYPNN